VLKEAVQEYKELALIHHYLTDKGHLVEVEDTLKIVVHLQVFHHREMLVVIMILMEAAAAVALAGLVNLELTLLVLHLVDLVVLVFSCQQHLEILHQR